MGISTVQKKSTLVSANERILRSAIFYEHDLLYVLWENMPRPFCG
jgi:hypothetical protein